MWCILKYNNSWFAKGVKYFSGGMIVALSQIGIIVAMVELIGLNTQLQQNIANLISMEISVIIGYWIHANYTWSTEHASPAPGFAAFARFQIFMLFPLMLRSLAFYGLSVLGVHFLHNTLVGIGLSVLLNFVGYERLVFGRRGR